MTDPGSTEGDDSPAESGPDELDIELRHFRQVAAVMDHGSVTRAAAELAMSVSALSRSLKAIEQALGAPLFVASGSGVQPTDLGRLFISRGREMLAAAAALGRHIERNPTLQGGRVAIGIGAKALELSAGDVALEFLTEFPQVSLEIRCGLVGDLAPALRAHELDFVAGQPAPLLERTDLALDVVPLVASPLVLAARAGHPLFSRPGFTLMDAFDYLSVAGGQPGPRLFAAVLELQARCTRPLARSRAWPAVLAPMWSMIERLMQDADALTVLPPTELADAVRSGRVVPIAFDGWDNGELALMTPRSRPLGHAARLFHDRLRAAYGRRVQEDYRLIAEWLPGSAAGLAAKPPATG